jgi:hypothetical protein
MQMIHSFSPLRAHVHRYLAIEPGLCPPGIPLVLDGWSRLCPDAPPSMNIYAAKLLIFFNPVGIHFLWLILQLVALHETVTAGFSTEAKHSPEIFFEN